MGAVPEQRGKEVHGQAGDVRTFIGNESANT